MARVLAVALVQTEKAMAFAAKEIDGIDDLDAIEDRCALAQTGKFLVSDSIDTRHQINHSERSLLERQDSELSVDRGSARHQTAAFGVLDLGPSSWTHPNVTVFRGERAECMEFFSVALSVEIIRPEIDSLPAKQELRRAPSEEGLQEFQIAFDT